jgi:hypothetical protein
MLPAYTLDQGPWSMVNFDCLTPLEEQPEPPNILALTTALVQRWPMTNLLDILKDTELRVRFTEAFRTTCARRCYSAAYCCAFTDSVRTQVSSECAVAGNSNVYLVSIEGRETRISRRSVRSQNFLAARRSLS